MNSISKGAKPKYIVIAQQIIAQIDSGQVKQNAKLPSLRVFCRIHDISMTTALSCYRYLEKYGYALAEYKKGYFVKRPLEEKTALPFPYFKSKVCVNNTRTAFTTNNEKHHPLATAQLDEQLVDSHLIKRCITSATKRVDFKINYDEAQGNQQLRHQLAVHLSRHGLLCSQHELVITHGCLDAVLIALECVSKPKDVIAVSSPCYSGLLDILSLLDRFVLEIPSTESGIDLDQLESAMEQRSVSACLLTANHQNPTGHSLNNQQKQKLVDMATRYQIPIIEDDVFRELSHQRAIPLPIKYFDQQGWVIWCSSISKTLAPGLRVGWCLPGRFMQKVQQQRRVRTLGHNQPIQLALTDYFAKGYYGTHIKKVNRILAAQCAQYIEFLKRHLPASSEVFTPDGGLVLWIKIFNIDTEKLALDLLSKNIVIKHGNLFSTTSHYQDCIRINIGSIPNADIYSELKTVCQLAQESTYRIKME